MREIVLVGVPIDSHGKAGGTELAPGVWREQGIVEALGARDAGDLPVRIVGEERDPASGIVGYPTVVTTCEGVRDGVAPLLASGAFTVVLGGCCSLVPGVAAALRTVDDGPVGLAYIDGHLDTYDPHTSPTGEAADMPVAICACLGDRELTGLGPAVGAEGPRAVGERIAEQLAADAGHFWLSIDVDVLSGAAMPATPVQQVGGLSMDELAELARPLARHPACVGLNLLCHEVDMDDAAHTSGRALVELLARVLAV